MCTWGNGNEKIASRWFSFSGALENKMKDRIVLMRQSAACLHALTLKTALQLPTDGWSGSKISFAIRSLVGLLCATVRTASVTVLIIHE